MPRGVALGIQCSVEIVTQRLHNIASFNVQRAGLHLLTNMLVWKNVLRGSTFTNSWGISLWSQPDVAFKTGRRRVLDHTAIDVALKTEGRIIKDRS